MNRLPNFNPDFAGFTPNEAFEKAQRELFLKLAAAEEDWYDDCLKAVMPEKIYALKPKMMTNRTDRRQLLCWIKKHDVRVEVDQDNTKRIIMGKSILGEFSVKFPNGKIEITAKTIPQA